MKSFIAFFLFLFFFAPIPTQAAPDPKAGQPEILFENAENLDVDDVVNNTHNWRPMTKKSGLPAWYSGIVWYRLALANPDPLISDWLFLIRINGYYRIDFYITEPDGRRTHGVGGDTVIPKERTVYLREPAFPLSIPVGQTRTLYFRAQVHGPLMLPWSLLPAAEFQHYRSIDEGVFAACLGVMIALFFSNLLFYFSLRDRIFVHYLLLEAVVIVFSFVVTSMADFYFPHGGVPGFRWYTPMSGASMAATAHFARKFLEVEKFAPRLNLALKAFVVVIIGVALLATYQLKPIYGTFGEIGFMIMAVLTLTAALIALYRGYRPARLYFVSWFLLMAPSIFFVLVLSGVLPDMIGVSLSFVVGAALETLVLAFALASRINDQRRELLDKIEQKVQERTAELRAVNVALEKQRAATVQSARMSALGAMAGGVAHEINNPLAVILSTSSLIRKMLGRGAANPEVLDSLLAKLDGSVKRISKITGGLLDFTRGGPGDPLMPVAVAKLLEDTLDLCETELRTHGIRVETEHPQKDLAVACREVQITQILVNLIFNSRDALADLPDKWIRISTSKIGAQVEISVTDSGPGIPIGMQSQVMEPFFTTKPPGKGTGLGLSISKGIAEAHGGSLKLDPTSSNTRFVLTLPGAKTLSKD